MSKKIKDHYLIYFVVIILILVLSIVGCAFGEKMKRIEPGMHKSKVKEILGEPDGYKRSGKYESIQYTDRVISGWDVKSTTDYTIVFKNNKVVEYGPGKVRKKDDANTLFLVPIQ